MLLIECSFLAPEDRDRAGDYEHLHLEDFLERAELFQNEAIVLTHFSQRYRVEEIREVLRRLPDALAARDPVSARLARIVLRTPLAETRASR